MASSREKLNRASFILMETIKDYVLSSVASTAAARYKLTATQAQELQQLLNQSIEAGYHRGAVGFMKEVDSVIPKR